MLSSTRYMPFCRGCGHPLLQRGMTLMELLIAMTISLIVALAMVGLMANTLGTGTETIKMTRLSHEMRTAMQLMTRDLRRANFHSNEEICFGNISCNPDTTKIKVVEPLTANCFQFYYDRGGDGDLDVGKFQRFTRSSINVLQMTVDDTAADSCGDDWGQALDITDPDIIDVTAFTISSADSYNEVISAAGDTQTVSKIRLTMTAALRNPAQGIPVSRTIEDMIYVRNRVLCPGGACP